MPQRNAASWRDSSNSHNDPNQRRSEIILVLKIDGDDGIVVIVSTRRTRVGDPVLRKGPFKGKRVEFASMTRIKKLQDIADDFMLDIFGFEPGEYFITDLSSLHDFVGVDDIEIGDMLKRIREVYGLDVADLPNSNLLEIFRRLHDKQDGGLSGGLP